MTNGVVLDQDQEVIFINEIIIIPFNPVKKKGCIIGIVSYFNRCYIRKYTICTWPIYLVDHKGRI